MSGPQFVAIGHVTIDRFGRGERPGGAALYAAVTAHRLGLRAGLLTSHGADFPLDDVPPQIEVVTVDAARTTAFVHREDDGHRGLVLEAAARPLGVHDVPEDWAGAELVLLAPVLHEVDPTLAAAFGEATIAAAAQGWLRGLGPGGVVGTAPWAPDPALLAALQALFVSAEDVRGQEAAMLQWIQRLPLAVVTAAEAGAVLYVNLDRHEIPPRPARVVDDTGAGDVFAAAFLIHYHRHGDPWEAAAAATCAASLSVEGAGWSAVPDRDGLEAALHEYRTAAS